MKAVLFSLFTFFYVMSANAEGDLKGFGVIREFGSTDNAALFGLLPESGSLQITGCGGPKFLVEVGCRVGQLDEVSMSRIFQKSSKPMTQAESEMLLSQWKGAQVIYLEGYDGALCTNKEYQVTANGDLDGQPFATTFRFVALPNSDGSCTYQTFSTTTRN